jgi:hypothetical protein
VRTFREEHMSRTADGTAEIVVEACVKVGAMTGYRTT